MMAWFRKHAPALALALIVSAAAGLSLAWVFVVPIFQSPDEPQHLDYALCLYEHRRPFRANDLTPIRDKPEYQNYYGLKYICYFLHPYTTYLIGRAEQTAISFNPEAKMPPGYGSRAYFQALDREVPSRKHLQMPVPPSLAWGYPCGYYALLALWIGLIRVFSHSLVWTFFGARIFSVMLLVVSLLASYGTLRELRYRRRFALLLTACIGMFPLTSFVSSYVQPDNLSFTLVSLVFYGAVRLRREPDSVRVAGWLGATLGALLITKPHYLACVLVPVLALALVELLRRQCPWWRRLAVGMLLLIPSLLTGWFYLWVIWGSGYDPVPAVHEGPWLLRGLDGLQKAFHDFYAGFSHNSFWGLFGWVDTPLVIRSKTTTAILKAIILVVGWVVLALTLLRLEQVTSRLIGLVRRGRARTALRLLVSNPPINAYFLFTALMFYLHIRTNNFFCAQGRNWFPLLLPIFLTAVAYAPRALTLRRARTSFAAALLAGLVVYAGAGSYYGIKSITERYYAPNYDRPMAATSLALQPAGMSQMTWKDNGGDGLGADPFVVFRLPQPEFVYGLRLKFRLTNPKNDPALFEAYWMRTGVNTFTEDERSVRFTLRPRPEEKTLTVWINDTIDQIRLDPDTKPCHFELEELTVLRPPDAGASLLTRR